MKMPKLNRSCLGGEPGRKASNGAVQAGGVSVATEGWRRYKLPVRAPDAATPDPAARG